MTERNKNIQTEKSPGAVDQAKIESVKKADAAVKSMSDFTSPEVLYQELITSVRKYHPSTDISMIQKAYEVAREAHKDQKRKSGAFMLTKFKVSSTFRLTICMHRQYSFLISNH